MDKETTINRRPRGYSIHGSNTFDIILNPSIEYVQFVNYMEGDAIGIRFRQGQWKRWGDIHV